MKEVKQFLDAFADGSIGEEKEQEEEVKASFDNYEIQNILQNTKNIRKNNLHTYANSRNTDFMLFVYTSNQEDPGY